MGSDEELDVAGPLESLIAASKELCQLFGKDTFYPHLYWWDVERYLKLVRRGAIFRVENKKLAWRLSEDNEGEVGSC